MSLREGNGNPLQYSCLENSMDGGAWQATVHGVAKSQTQLNNFTSHFNGVSSWGRWTRLQCHQSFQLPNLTLIHPVPSATKALWSSKSGFPKRPYLWAGRSAAPPCWLSLKRKHVGEVGLGMLEGAGLGHLKKRSDDGL